MDAVEHISIVTKEFDAELADNECFRVFFLWQRRLQGKSPGGIFYIEQSEQKLGMPTVELKAKKKVGGGFFEPGQEFFREFGGAQHTFQQAIKIIIIKHQGAEPVHAAAEVVIQRNAIAQRLSISLAAIGHIKFFLFARIEPGVPIGQSVAKTQVAQPGIGVDGKHQRERHFDDASQERFGRMDRLVEVLHLVLDFGLVLGVFKQQKTIPFVVSGYLIPETLGELGADVGLNPLSVQGKNFWPQNEGTSAGFDIGYQALEFAVLHGNGGWFAAKCLKNMEYHGVLLVSKSPGE
jgi:hypothetical protein